jgi:hypothetical protein
LVPSSESHFQNSLRERFDPRWVAKSGDQFKVHIDAHAVSSLARSLDDLQRSGNLLLVTEHYVVFAMVRQNWV